MTQIRLGLVKPLQDGTYRQVAGRVHLRPFARQSTAPAEPTDVILPASFSVVLKPDQPAPVVELAPGYWRGVESTQPAGLTRTVVVPDLPGVVDWADLVDVDPATLEPSVPAVPAWEAAVAAVTAQSDRAAAASDGAVEARQVAEQAAQSAHDDAVAATEAAASIHALAVVHLGDGLYSITTGDSDE